MDRKRIGWWFSLIALIVLSIFYFRRDGKEIHSINGNTMGTSYNIKLINKPSDNLKGRIDSLLVDFNSVLSTYDPSSEISRLNNSDSFHATSELLLSMLGYSKSIWEQTEGAFDPTVMPVVNFWGFGYEERTGRDSTGIDSLMNFVGYERVEILNGGLVKKPKGVMLDFSAIAKGYGVDVVSMFLERNGYEDHMVEIGGEVKCRGNTHEDRTWKIGIEDPTVQQVSAPKPFFVVKLDHLAIATSGNYRNYYELDGKTISHTINPKTGFPERNDLLSASVISTDCYRADALATALMVMGLERARNFCESNSISAALVYDDLGTKVDFTHQFESFLWQE